MRLHPPLQSKPICVPNPPKKFTIRDSPLAIAATFDLIPVFEYSERAPPLRPWFVVALALVCHAAETRFSREIIRRWRIEFSCRFIVGDNLRDSRTISDFRKIVWLIWSPYLSKWSLCRLFVPPWRTTASPVLETAVPARSAECPGEPTSNLRWRTGEYRGRPHSEGLTAHLMRPPIIIEADYIISILFELKPSTGNTPNSAFERRTTQNDPLDLRPRRPNGPTLHDQAYSTWASRSIYSPIVRLESYGKRPGMRGKHL